MAFDLSDCQFTGPALPEPFVKFELENELTKLKLLPKTTGSEGKQLKDDWEAYRRHLAQLAVRGGPLRVRNQAIEPLRERLGYTGEIESAADVETREGREDGGYLLTVAGRCQAPRLDHRPGRRPRRPGQARAGVPLQPSADCPAGAAGQRRARGPADQRRRAAAADLRSGPARLAGDLHPRSRLEAQPGRARLVPAALGAGLARLG